MKMGEKMPPRAKYLNYGKLLTLSAAQEGDGGKYMCTATNSAGEDVHYFDVIVEGKPAAGCNCALIRALRPLCLLSERVDAEVQVVFFCFFDSPLHKFTLRASQVGEGASPGSADHDWLRCSHQVRGQREALTGHHVEEKRRIVQR